MTRDYIVNSSVLGSNKAARLERRKYLQEYIPERQRDLLKLVNSFSSDNEESESDSVGSLNLWTPNAGTQKNTTDLTNRYLKKTPLFTSFL